MSAGAALAPRERVGRLFWKFFVLITVFQVGADLAVRAWPIGRRHVVDALGMPAAPVIDASVSSSGLTLQYFMGDVVAGLASAALLAWLLSKPIRSLHAAITAAANGQLDIRIADRMGPGDDELKDLGVAFDSMIARLRTLIVAQRQLLNDVSHEMRSPMARIQAAIGVAHQQPDQAPALMERIERESVRIDKLIGELLALSRLQADIDSRLEADIELRELVSEVIDDARFEASASGLGIGLASDCDGIVRGNAELLRRAIENVVRNAIKYGRDGGHVEVSVTAVPARPAVLITIRDHGSGVPEADLASIFDPFFRSASHADHEGSGLGLAIARRIVGRHGGTIGAANAPGGGLAVNIVLPVQPA